MRKTTRASQLGAMVLAMMLFLAGCAGFNVRSDWDREASFDRLQRFAWLEPATPERPDPFADNSLLRKRLKEVVESALAARGYRSVELEESPDFLVTWAVTLDERLRVNDGFGVGFGGGYGYGYGLGRGGSGSTVRNYQESTLVIDFLNPETKDLLWRGWGTGVVGTRDRGRGDDRMAAGVKAILNAYPPRK